MGQPQLDQFTVNVAKDVNGIPVGLYYYDREGCGHESHEYFVDSAQLIAYHDDHRQSSHRQEPRKARCKHEILPGNPETRCQLAEHDRTVKHEVKFK